MTVFSHRVNINLIIYSNVCVFTCVFVDHGVQKRIINEEGRRSQRG